MTEDRIISGVTTLIGLAAMFFGISQETVSVLQSAVPTVVGGIMAIVSVVSYLTNRRLAKSLVYKSIMANENANANKNVRQPRHDPVETAKNIGLI